MKQLRLLIGCPQASAGTLAVPEAGTIEDDHPVGFQQELAYSAGIVVIPGHGVAVDQDDWLPRAPVAVMQPDAIDLDEGPFGRMPALGSARRNVIGEGQCAKGDGTQCEAPCASGFWEEVHGCLFYGVRMAQRKVRARN